MIDRLKIDMAFYDRGKELVIGVDEVGRGPLAGPLYVAACAFDLQAALHETEKTPAASSTKNSTLWEEIKDSKKLSEKKREKLSKFIQENAVAYAIKRVDHKIIDKKGIVPALQMGAYTSVVEVLAKLGVLLGSSKYIVLTDSIKISALPENKQESIVKGDDKSISIAAASIIAKVTRDHEMMELAKKFPEYGFEKHKGYGTKVHIEKLKELGHCEIHRKSFEPLKSML